MHCPASCVLIYICTMSSMDVIFWTYKYFLRVTILLFQRKNGFRSGNHSYNYHMFIRSLHAAEICWVFVDN